MSCCLRRRRWGWLASRRWRTSPCSTSCRRCPKERLQQSIESIIYCSTCAPMCCRAERTGIDLPAVVHIETTQLWSERCVFYVDREREKAISKCHRTGAEGDEEVEETPSQDDDVINVQPGRVDDGRVSHSFWLNENECGAIAYRESIKSPLKKGVTFQTPRPPIPKYWPNAHSRKNMGIPAKRMVIK